MVDRIRELAAERGMNIAQLERKSGIPSKTISKWDENAPSVWKCKAVADALETTIDNLLGSTPKTEPVISAEEYDILREGLLALMENANSAFQLVKSSQAKTEINKEWETYKALLNKLCTE